MTVSSGAVERSTRYWVVPLVRAVLALAAAAVITFTSAHSAGFGLLVFGVFAIASGLATAVLSWMLAPNSTRGLFVVVGVVGVVAGVLALTLGGGSLGFFLYLVTVWALVTGFLESAGGFRARRTQAPARDWMVGGGLTVLLAVVFLLVPPDLHTAYHAPEGAVGAVTAPVVLVGLLGAYQAVLGVYLVIGAFSLKWGTSVEKAQGSRA